MERERIIVAETGDLEGIRRLFGEHLGEPYVYPADLELIDILLKTGKCEVFEARVYGRTVGSIYALKYMYNCGLIGALLVHRSWRRVGIGTALLLKALTWLDLPYTYLFVDPGNTAAKGLFGKAGFKQLYRTLDKKTPVGARLGRSRVRS